MRETANCIRACARPWRGSALTPSRISWSPLTGCGAPTTSTRPSANSGATGSLPGGAPMPLDGLPTTTAGIKTTGALENPTHPGTLTISPTCQASTTRLPDMPPRSLSRARLLTRNGKANGFKIPGGTKVLSRGRIGPASNRFRTHCSAGFCCTVPGLSDRSVSQSSRPSRTAGPAPPWRRP